MRKVLILGSKPDAKVPEFDIAYCANASGALYAEQLNSRNGVLNTVVAASELISSPIRSSAEKAAWQAERIAAIHGLKHHHIKLVSGEHFPSVFNSLKAFDEHKSIEIIPHSKYESWLKSALRAGYPIVTKQHFSPGISVVKELTRFALEHVKYRVFEPYLVNSLYRQSTGMNCLLEAISRYGKTARYIIVGIGFQNRNLYEGGAVNTWTPRAKMDRAHVLVDRFIFNKLKEEYTIDFVGV